MAHVPSCIRGDARGAIEATTWKEAKAPFLERLLEEMEAYAPGFRSLVLAAEGHTPDDLQAGNANLVGGDIGSGSYTLDQQLIFRPLAGWFRYKTPIRGLYVSGAATHPGGGVHGAAGANAARVLLADLRLAAMLEWPRAAQRRQPRVERPIATTAEGTGPLRQHDYWVAITGAGCTPERAIGLIQAKLPELASNRLVRFTRPRGQQGPLGVGDQLRISIPGSRPAYVQVAQADQASVSLRTLENHPELGRVSFQAEAGDFGGILVRVRARTRANTTVDRLKYELAGKPLQTYLWSRFLEQVARDCGGRVIGSVRHASGEVEPTADDELPTQAATFSPAR
jgi:hypothetical protein